MSSSEAGYLLLALGLPFWAIGIPVFIRRLRLKLGFKGVMGHVIKINTVGGRIHQPIIGYEVNGETYQVKSKATYQHSVSYGGTTRYSEVFQIGDSVSVLFDPMNPENAHLENFYDFWMLPSAMCAIGGFLSASAISILG